MSNPTISQIKVGNTTYDIKDATVLQNIPAKTGHFQKADYFNDGTSGQIVYTETDADTGAVYTRDTFDMCIWGRITSIHMSLRTTQAVYSGNTPNVVGNNYGNHSNYTIFTAKDYKFIKPSTTYFWHTVNEFHTGSYDYLGRCIWCGSAYWGTTHEWPAGIVIRPYFVFINTGYWTD